VWLRGRKLATASFHSARRPLAGLKFNEHLKAGTPGQRKVGQIGAYKQIG
jgi:hypothetical protein